MAFHCHAEPALPGVACSAAGTWRCDEVLAMQGLNTAVNAGVRLYLDMGGTTMETPASSVQTRFKSSESSMRSFSKVT